MELMRQGVEHFMGQHFVSFSFFRGALQGDKAARLRRRKPGTNEILPNDACFATRRICSRNTQWLMGQKIEHNETGSTFGAEFLAKKLGQRVP